MTDLKALLAAATPKVKPLVWHSVKTYGGDCYDANGGGVVYRIVPRASGDFWLTDPTCGGYYSTIDAAEAAAQAGCTRRILSALEPQDTTLAAALIEAEKALQMFADHRSWLLNGPCDPDSGNFTGCRTARDTLDTIRAITGGGDE